MRLACPILHGTAPPAVEAAIVAVLTVGEAAITAEDAACGAEAAMLKLL